MQKTFLPLSYDIYPLFYDLGENKMKFDENTLFDYNGNTILKIYHSKVESGKRTLREHHHTECELSLVISGSGTYYVNETEYSFTDGDMFLFGSNEAHCITNITSNMNLLNIQFEPRILWENPDNFELLNIFNMRNKKFKNKFQKTDTPLQHIILNIEKEIHEKNNGYKIQIKNLLFSALIHIIRTYDYIKDTKSYTFHRPTTQKLKDAMIYIDNNLENKITLKEIAAVAYMTETYFSSVFKKFNGISPWEYITIKRVEKAVDLIKTTDMTKLEIAEKCGFSSSSNFYKAFFNITGKKPSNYVKNTCLDFVLPY